MTTFKRSSLVLAVLSLFGVTVHAQPANCEVFPKIVNTKFSQGYIPVGFDTNDNAQIVAEGLFPNTCYKPAGVKVKVNHDKKEIRLYPQAYKYDGMCLQMIVPFNKEIDLGLLQVGDYKLINEEKESPKELGTLKVSLATNSAPDDFLYAPVSQAWFDNVDGKHFVAISGEFPQTCFEMKEVIVRVQSNVIVVQPIAEMTDEQCEQRPLPYNREVEVPQLAKGRYLIHVRSLNGKAFNNLVDVR